jgi:MOSC domain-containing protein YiiM
MNYDIQWTTVRMPELLHFYISHSHNYFGHHGQPPGDAPMIEVDRIECLAGRGVRGDRFFDFKNDYKGQITLFSQEVYEDLCKALRIFDKAPSVFRRNVITSGVDLASWFNAEFELQGVRFRGRGECSPCYWMDQAFGPGAEHALEGRGGLRAMILTDGILHTGPIP